MRGDNRPSTLYEAPHEDDGPNLNYYFNGNDDQVQILSTSRKKPFTKVQYIPMVILGVLTILIFFVPLLDQVAQNALHKVNNKIRNNSCPDTCSFSLVESIPDGVFYKNNSPIFPTTFDTWINLIENAQKSIEIGSFYWTLRGVDVIPHPTAKQGEEIFQALLDAGSIRKIKIRIAQSAPDPNLTSNDTNILEENSAEVRSVNFTQLLGGGVLHTKIWIIDDENFYIGSANMDWRALTQVKEMGVVGRKCRCLAKDLKKIFDVYWELGKDAIIPDHWDNKFSTNINKENPIKIVDTQNISYTGFLSSSPLQLNPQGRTNDIDAILNTIQTANKFIYVAVMDYLPLILYTKRIQFWPVIDDALKSAAINGIEIKMLISHWKHSRDSEDNFLKSLLILNESYKWVSIEIKHFVVPTSEDQEKIPFGRVNHNKYMVTDKTAYIGTSNWSGDYFINTAGVGFVFEDDKNQTNTENSIRSQLQSVFERDWTSNYTIPIQTLKL
ncbi:5'-3' exonuclease PLD3-like [Onthophagus taurus]|uniref:5'-3' exonuclease PLD3-like n=1 Tax=Onthophagus taurus TaxID=166361 RepID=UPI0039BE2FEE